MSSPTTIQAAPGVNLLPLKTRDDWRALFHQIVPIIVSTMISANIMTDNQGVLWIPYVFAIADPLWSIANTKNKVRQIIYGLLVLLQAGSGITALIQIFAAHSNPVVAPLITAAGAILSGILARTFTPTPTSIISVPISSPTTLPVEDVA